MVLGQTEQAALELIDRNLSQLKKNVDFSKTFARLDDDILFSKLQCYGLNSDVLKLILKNLFFHNLGNS